MTDPIQCANQHCEAVLQPEGNADEWGFVASRGGLLCFDCVHAYLAEHSTDPDMPWCERCDRRGWISIDGEAEPCPECKGHAVVLRDLRVTITEILFARHVELAKAQTLSAVLETALELSQSMDVDLGLEDELKDARRNLSSALSSAASLLRYHKDSLATEEAEQGSLRG